MLKIFIGRHSGVVIAHFPNEISTPELNNKIIKAFDTLTEKDFNRNLIILEPGKIRIRRK
jgi:hypothetical protein